MPIPLLSLALDLTSSLGEEDRYRRIVTALRDHAGADAANLMRLEGRVLRPLHNEGLSEDVRDATVHVDSMPVLRRIVEADGPVRFTDPEGLVGLVRYSADSPGAGKPLAVLASAPLKVEGEVVGILSMSSSNARAFEGVSDDDIAAFAALAAATIRTADLMAALEGAAAASRQVAKDLFHEQQQREAGPLLGDSDAVQVLRDRIRRLGAGAGPVLIVGATNTGKAAIARAVHDASPRSDQVFVPMDCGSVRGSVTDRRFYAPEPRWEVGGSDRMVLERTGGQTIGRLEMAAGGTLFLQDVERLPEPTQEAVAEMLRAMRRIRADGRTPAPDVRVLASTTADLAMLVQSGRFRGDLHQEITSAVIRAPMLRERVDDIPAIAEHFLREHSTRMGRRVERFSDASIARLQDHRWPGNLRELQNVLERIVLQTNGVVAHVDETMLDDSLPLGDTHYRLVRRIGEGGMGEVWIARHELLARPAAVKLIRPEGAGSIDESSNAWKRFHREARATSRLRSPHTVELYEFGIAEGGALFFVMELLTGIDLSSMVARFGPLPPARVIFLIRQALRSLAEAHAEGLVHRDVKPSNLIACRLGVEYDYLKVVDFGIVKALSGEDAEITGAGTPTGTPAFMAPELATGEGPVDGRTDLYSLAATAWTLLTGRLVFGGGSPIRQMMSHIQTPPRPPSEVREGIPPELDAILLRCLAKDPDQRPPDALTLWRELGTVPLTDCWGPCTAERWWAENADELDLVEANAGQSTATPQTPR